MRKHERSRKKGKSEINNGVCGKYNRCLLRQPTLPVVLTLLNTEFYISESAWIIIYLDTDLSQLILVINFLNDYSYDTIEGYNEKCHSFQFPLRRGIDTTWSCQCVLKVSTYKSFCKKDTIVSQIQQKGCLEVLEQLPFGLCFVF